MLTNTRFFNTLYNMPLKPLLLVGCLVGFSSGCAMQNHDRPLVPVTLLPQSTNSGQGFMPLSLEVTQIDQGLLLRTDNKVFFALDSAVVLPSAANRLNEIVQFINQYPDRNVAIEGHTDSTGAANYNLELSEMRAMSVKNALIQRGIMPTRMVTRGYGESRPIASNSTAASRQRNRRVEIIVLNNPTTPTPSSRSGMNYLPM